MTAIRGRSADHLPEHSDPHPTLVSSTSFTLTSNGATPPPATPSVAIIPTPSPDLELTTTTPQSVTAEPLSISPRCKPPKSVGNDVAAGDGATEDGENYGDENFEEDFEDDFES